MSRRLNTSSKEVRISEIFIGEVNPRRHSDAESLKQLANSLENMGMISAVLLRESKKGGGKKYELIAGSRRLNAAKENGDTTIRASVLPAHTTDARALELALAENLHREDLHPLDLADAMGRLMESGGYTQEALAEVLGISVPTVSTTLKLNKMPPKMRKDFLESGMPKHVAVEVLRVKDREERRRLWEEALEDPFITVDEVRLLRRRLNKASDSSKSPGRAAARRLNLQTVTLAMRKSASLLKKLASSGLIGVASSHELDELVEALENLEGRIGSVLKKVGKPERV